MEQAFSTLKVTLTSKPVLQNLDFSQPFLVHTDASEISLDTVLSQEFDREEHLSVYLSRKLTLTEW